MADTVSDVIKSPEAAKLLNVDIATLIKAADSGQVPCWKTPGGHRRFHRSAVLALLEQRAIQTVEAAS